MTSRYLNHIVYLILVIYSLNISNLPIFDILHGFTHIINLENHHHHHDFKRSIHPEHIATSDHGVDHKHPVIAFLEHTLQDNPKEPLTEFNLRYVILGYDKYTCNASLKVTVSFQFIEHFKPLLHTQQYADRSLEIPTPPPKSLYTHV